MILIAILIAATLPAPTDVARDSVDLIELNHFFDEHGRLVFDQLIFYRIDKAGDEEVLEWRLVKHPSQPPQRDWQRGGYVATWTDGETVREVRTDSYRESWTQYDPELLAREALPKEKRRGLRHPLRVR